MLLYFIYILLLTVNFNSLNVDGEPLDIGNGPKILNWTQSNYLTDWFEPWELCMFYNNTKIVSIKEARALCYMQSKPVKKNPWECIIGGSFQRRGCTDGGECFYFHFDSGVK